MTFNDFLSQLKRHEGYRGEVYIDTAGVPTGGWGHAFLIGSEIPQGVAETFLWRDLIQVDIDYEMLQIDLFEHAARKYVVKNMLFNLGLSKLLLFKQFILALKIKDWDLAADEMMNSQWAKQVGNRAKELSLQMRTGIFQKT